MKMRTSRLRSFAAGRIVFETQTLYGSRSAEPDERRCGESESSSEARVSRDVVIHLPLFL